MDETSKATHEVKGLGWQSETTSSLEIWDLLGQCAENGLSPSLASQPEDYFLATLRALKFIKLLRQLSESDMINFGRSASLGLQAAIF